jgi:hypothetical protein
MSDNPGTKQQKESALPKEQLEAGKKWLQLVAQARADKTLKQRLMDAPVAVLRKHGINVRPGLDVRVVENTDKIVYLTLPSVSQLSDKQLDGVVGGTITEAVNSAGQIAATVITLGVNTLLGVGGEGFDDGIDSHDGGDGSQ